MVHNRAGYYTQEPGSYHRIYLFSSPAIKEAARGFSKDRILLALHNAGAIQTGGREKGGKGYQVQYRLPGGNRAWFYAVDPERLTTDH